jgi:hypothetical protein
MIMQVRTGRSSDTAQTGALWAVAAICFGPLTGVLLLGVLALPL